MAGEYELVVVTGGGEEASNHKKATDEIKKLIESEKGEIVNIDDWGKKELAYQIAKNDTGYYSLLTFRGSPSTPNNLNSKMRLMENLLRYMIVKKEMKKEKVEKVKARKK